MCQLVEKKCLAYKLKENIQNSARLNFIAFHLWFGLTLKNASRIDLESLEQNAFQLFLELIRKRSHNSSNY